LFHSYSSYYGGRTFGSKPVCSKWSNICSLSNSIISWHFEHSQHITLDGIKGDGDILNVRFKVIGQAGHSSSSAG
jgi:hypothetical protein